MPSWLSVELRDLLEEMWTESARAVSPDGFLNAFWQIVPFFRGYQQQVKPFHKVEYLEGEKLIEGGEEIGRT